MSTQVSNEAPRKQSANIYFVMLLMSMLFLLVAVIAMFVELSRYESSRPWVTDEARPQQVMRSLETPHYV